MYNIYVFLLESYLRATENLLPLAKILEIENFEVLTSLICD